MTRVGNSLLVNTGFESHLKFPFRVCAPRSTGAAVASSRAPASGRAEADLAMLFAPAVDRRAILSATCVTPRANKQKTDLNAPRSG